MAELHLFDLGACALKTETHFFLAHLRTLWKFHIKAVKTTQSGSYCIYGRLGGLKRRTTMASEAKYSSCMLFNSPVLMSLGDVDSSVIFSILSFSSSTCKCKITRRDYKHYYQSNYTRNISGVSHKLCLKGVTV